MKKNQGKGDDESDDTAAAAKEGNASSSSDPFGVGDKRCFIGQWSDAKRATFDDNYMAILRRSQVVVTCKPCAYDGDYRTWEALASGAVVVMDPPDRTLQGEGQVMPLAHAPLQHGDHVQFYAARDKGNFMAVMRGLLEAPLVERYRLAERGHMHALKHHRAVSRIDGVFVALAQIWSQWPVHP